MTDLNPKSDPNMAEKERGFPTTLTLAEKTHRPILDIELDIDKAKAEYFRLEPLVRDDNRRINSLIETWDKAKVEWNKTRPGEPFEPGRFYLPETKPAANDQLQREFHRQHYKIDALQREMEAAKKALISG